MSNHSHNLREMSLLWAEK